MESSDAFLFLSRISHLLRLEYRIYYFSVLNFGLASDHGNSFLCLEEEEKRRCCISLFVVAPSTLLLYDNEEYSSVLCVLCILYCT